MKTKSVLLLGILLAFASGAHALDLAGTWESKISTPDGDFKISYVFTQADEKLSGTVRSEWGDWPMLDLKVADEIVSFRVDTDNGVFATTGTIKDGHLAVTINGPQGERHETFTRVAAKVAGAGHGRQPSTIGCSSPRAS